MEEFMKGIKQFNEEGDWDKFHSSQNLTKSISIESGELLEFFYGIEKIIKKMKFVKNLQMYLHTAFKQL